MQGLQNNINLYAKRVFYFVAYSLKSFILIVAAFIFLFMPTLSIGQPVVPIHPRLKAVELPIPTWQYTRPAVPQVTANTKSKSSASSTALLNRFYVLQKTNKPAAEQTLLQLLKNDPNNVVALSELGYMYIDAHKPQQALQAFESVYRITGDYAIAAQIGYLLNELGEQHKAYYYFEKASHSPDPKLRQESNQALTNLAGQQLHVFPDPYFADIYLSPLYDSRFDLGVLPFQSRFGVALGQYKQLELYAGIRGSRDDKSRAAGTSPQIFEDNVVLFGLGARYQPFHTVPLYFYSEVGKAYDLIDQGRPRWRNDFRGGAFYQDFWGAVPTYSENFKFTFKPIGQVYAESSFYTRYDNNLITSLTLRQGFRVIQYKSSSIGVYLRAFGIVDTNHEFYNNLAEIGPGIIWVPNNRYNVDVRFERDRGYYFNVNSPDPNPYGSHYNNNVVILELYQRF